jgi:signal transduction histidine kinase
MESYLKILLLEDCVDDVGLIDRQLKKEGILFHYKCVDSKDEFIDGLHSFKPDIILSDHSLPQFNSMEALEISRKQGFRHIPFILVTGTVSEEFAVSILKKGASDYILKSNLVKLPTAILKALDRKNNTVKRIQAELRIRNQNQELLKINKELDNFVYDISHNLRAPLMSLLGLINLVKDEDSKKDSTYLEYFSLMEKSVNRLDNTLQHILDYSRNTRKELDIQKIDFEIIINELFDQLKYIEGYNEIEKFIEIDKKLFYSDPYRISVILLNLISNSIKYRDNNKEKSFIRIKITVNTYNAEILFQDNGIGIEKPYQHKVFNMFFRATERSVGAGLGLYIVKEMVDKLRGKISLDSKVNFETTFKLFIPNNYNYLIKDTSGEMSLNL